MPPGEDKTSFDRHNRVLRVEYSKSTPNGRLVKDLMKLTYPMRRKEILTSDKSPFIDYPFLQVPEYVSNYNDSSIVLIF